MASFEELYPSMAKRLSAKDKTEITVEPVQVDGGTRPDPELERRYMSVSEAAEALGVVPMTVYRKIHNDELRVMKVGRRYRVFEPDVAALTTPKTKGEHT